MLVTKRECVVVVGGGGGEGGGGRSSGTSSARRGRGGRVVRGYSRLQCGSR